MIQVIKTHRIFVFFFCKIRFQRIQLKQRIVQRTVKKACKVKVLIVRQDRIGDVTLTTAMPREIRRAFPDALVSVLVRSYTADIYRYNPHIDEVIVLQEDESSASLGKRLRERHFDISLMPLPDKRITLALFAAGIPLRIGSGHKLYQFLTNTKSSFRRKYDQLRSEADYCLDQVRKLGVVPESDASEIFLSEDETGQRKDIRETYLGQKRFLIGVHCTSGNSAPNVSPAEYGRFLSMLSNDPEISVMVTDHETPVECRGIPRIHYPDFSHGLRQLIIHIAAFDLLISASTGPMHLAGALKVDTLSVFCPLPACHPTLWGPRGNTATFVMPENEYCSRLCPGDPKLCNFSGTGGINAEKLYSAVKDWKERKIHV